MFLSSQLPAYDLAFALTVHKCQGSEYDRILLLLPPDEHPLLSRELLYTAITRAKSGVFVLGTKAAFLSGVLQKWHRDTGLRSRLLGYLK